MKTKWNKTTQKNNDLATDFMFYFMLFIKIDVSSDRMKQI